MREFVKLVCGDGGKSCGLWYTTDKNKRTSNNTKLELRKYCKKCKKHTVFKEGK